MTNHSHKGVHMEKPTIEQTEFDKAYYGTEEPSTETVQNNEGGEVVDTPTPTETKFKVKYNGQEMELSQDELITNAQKGMNYDHIKSENDSLKKYSDSNKLLEELAKEANLEVNDFVKGLKESKQQEKLNNRIKELTEEGMSEEHAKRMASLELNQPTVVKPIEKVDTNDALVNEFKTLHAEFPETQAFKELTDFPQEVRDLISQGKSPLVAYTKYQVDSIKKQSEIDITNAANKSKDTGSLTSVEENTKIDPILEGFRNG